MATIADLPDDILLKIFISSSPRIKHAVHLYNVCQRWHWIMKTRFSMVKYLVYYHEDLCMSRFLRDYEIESNDDENMDNNVNNNALEVVPEQVAAENEDNNDLEIGNNLIEDNDEIIFHNELVNIYNQQFKAEIVDPTGRYLCIDVDEDKLDTQKSYIELLPNLLFLTVNAPADPDQEQSLIDLINSRVNIKGVDWRPSEQLRNGPPKTPLKNIEFFLFGNELTSSNPQTAYYLTSSLTQLYCYEDQLSIIEAVAQCPNLRRLHCYQLNHQGTSDSPLRKYQGPILNNLEIIELSLGPKWNPRDLKYFLRFMPNLKSIFLHLARPPIKMFTRPNKLFPQIENLVLEMSTTRRIPGKIERFEGLISMFPNLRNLGLRYFRIYTEDQLYHWLRRLPSLELIDIREWSMSLIDPIYGVEELSIPFESTLNPSKIEIWYNNLFDHPLHCNLINLTEEEPQLYFDEFVDGFNFMRHIFNKDFQKLPHFMIDDC